jgi:heme O synthase-like polyprenyltransferase
LLVLGLWWLQAALLGFKKGIDDTRWARSIFFKSLISLLVFCIVISASALL